MRPRDIKEKIAENIKKDFEKFSEEDQRSGYAEWMSKYWNELPTSMSDDEARTYLGIKTTETAYQEGMEAAQNGGQCPYSFLEKKDLYNAWVLGWVHTHKRYERYLNQNGWFFASNPEMEVWAEDQVKKGVLKRLWELVPKIGKKEMGKFVTTWAYSFVPANWTIEDLSKVFKKDFLVNYFGLFSIAPDYQI